MKEIICKNGERIKVDDEDYGFLSRFKWYMGSELNSKGGGYACCFIYGRKNTRQQTFMHQLIMAGFMCDHEDQDKSNNQKYNLRIATDQENGWNKGKNRAGPNGKPCTSQYKGVMKIKGQWVVRIKLTKKGVRPAKYTYGGPFKTELDGAKFYNREIVKLRGKWAWLNPIPEINDQARTKGCVTDEQ